LSEFSSVAFSDSVTDELASPQSVTASLRLPISDLEAKHYYHGLHSKPVLVARTGTDTWEPPAGPEAYLRRKELRTVCNHPLKAVWEDNLALRIHDILESKGKTTPIDVVEDQVRTIHCPLPLVSFNSHLITDWSVSII
jgi:hypothetical protein